VFYSETANRQRAIRIIHATKVPCSHAQRFAVAAEKQFGKKVCSVVRAVSNTDSGNAERTIHNLSAKCNLRLDVKISRVSLPNRGGKLAVLRFSDFLQCMITNHHFYSKLCGGFQGESLKAVLVQYWERFGRLFPNHTTVRKIRDGFLPAEAVIPIQMHNDEGRGKAKRAFLVVNTQGVLARPSNKVRKEFMKAEPRYVRQSSRGAPGNPMEGNS
jgi:hypothetical protein